MNILLVCTGNTCRSPLAEALLRQALAERGVERINIASAGTGAWDGSPASEGAYLVGLEHGLDLSAHRARLLTRDLVHEADLILTMSQHHRARVEALGGEGRVHALAEYAGEDAAAEVPDPYGSDLDDYRAAFNRLDGLMGAVADRIVAGS